MSASKVCVGMVCLSISLLMGLGSRAAEVAIPEPLKSWEGWALHGEEFRRCPFFANRQPQSAAEFVCAWPERLTLNLTARGGDFSQRWQVFADSWIALPGDNEQWPRAVRLNGVKAPLTLRDGVPQLYLAPGSYTVNGSFAWNSRPEQLTIPPQTGVVELSVDSRVIAQPERPGAAVWLGKRRTEQQAQQMNMQVYRLLKDDVPAFLTTHIRLQVSGEAREELLGKVLPEGFTPMALDSLLPARIEPDGALRVQLRPGQWTIEIQSRSTAVATEFKAPASERVQEEVWSYQANDRLRITAAEGAQSIDPAQANVPAQWLQLPAYRMAGDAVLKVVERSRGLENQDANQLSMHRQLWLDFEHSGYTFVDSITGTMRQGWRLDMAEPFRVMSARVGADNLLVTSGAGPDLSGIELRQTKLDLHSTGRLSSSSGRMPATGWQSRFDEVSGQLNLPPGHHLLTSFGAVDAPDSWAAGWRLLDFFIVLIVAVSAWKVRSIAFGVLALAALVLNHQEQPMLAWLMINLLIAVALAKVAPLGNLQTAITWYRNLSLAAIVLAFVPFAINQVRWAIYPQLEAAQGAYGILETRYIAEAAPAAAAAPMESGIVQSPAMVMDKAVTSERLDTRVRAFAEESKQAVSQRYAPGTVVQVGPGVPNWNYNTYRYSWSGPVDAGEQVRFVIASPFWMFLWRVSGVALLGAFIVGVAQLALRNVQFGSLKSALIKPVAAPLLVVCVVSCILNSPRVNAQVPDAELLAELRTRLTQPPACAPRCAETLAAQINVTADRLEMSLEVSALANVAVPIPVAVGRWEPENISVDGQSAGALYRDSQQSYWVALKKGSHTLRLSGRLAAAESIQLVFPQKPHAIATAGTGWEFSGINDGRLLTNALELVRQRTSAADKLSAATQFAAFVRVKRYVRFDLDWSVTTVVERVAPEKGAFTVEVPLLKDESVLTAGLVPRDKNGARSVQVGLSAGDRQVSWSSALPRATTMALAMSSSNDRTELWSFVVSPIWNVRFAGVPPVAPEGGGEFWTFDYFPRAGETLKLDIVRPEAAGSDTLALDSVNLSTDVGRRSSTSTLLFSYRSTQGGRHTLALPLNAQVMSVSADGAPVPVRPQDGELPLSLLPGSHTVEIRWQSDQGAELRTQSPAVDLKTSASNITSDINLGGERWVLFARGAGVGPVILYWGELLVFIAIAVLIGRYTESPLRTHDWLLLGLGLSTFSWSVLLLFAVWVFAMRWRASSSVSVDRVFNLRQVALGLLSLIAIVGLVSAIPSGLLRQPDMSIRSPSGGFTWFNDQTQVALPQVAVYSVPLIVYKVAILLWAMWLSFALLRWLPWGWRAFCADGMWRGKIVRPQPRQDSKA